MERTLIAILIDSPTLIQIFRRTIAQRDREEEMTRGKGGKFYDEDDLDYDEGDDWEDWEDEDAPPPVKPQQV